MIRLSLAALLTLVLPMTALAANPKISEFDPDIINAGGVVIIRGLNFTDEDSQVTVTVGNKDAVVLQAKLQEVTIHVPAGLKKGKHPVVVKVGNDASAASSIEITDDMELIRKREVDAHENVGEVPALQAQTFLRVYQPRLASGSGQPISIEVSGAAAYPPGTIIALKLVLDKEKQIVTRGEAKVLDKPAPDDARLKLFQTTLGPFRADLFAGFYAIEAEFKLVDQSRRIKRVFKQYFPSEEVQQSMKYAHHRNFLQVGTDDDERRELEALRRHFGQTTTAAEKLLEELEDNFCGTGKSLFREKNGKLKEAEWKDWLKKRSLKPLARREQDFNAKASMLKAKKTFVDAKNRFEDEQWREWLDANWRSSTKNTETAG
ncbi:MAG: IPT/TIG domain-containing protein [Planctomycetota bacterium]|jgi:hypothetical protein